MGAVGAWGVPGPNPIAVLQDGGCSSALQRATVFSARVRLEAPALPSSSGARCMQLFSSFWMQPGQRLGSYRKALLPLLAGTLSSRGYCGRSPISLRSRKMEVMP